VSGRDTDNFPLVGAVRTPGGLVRAPASQAPSAACGCGEAAVTVLVYATHQVRNGRTDRRTRAVPLCERHDSAQRAQAARRSEAVGRARLRASEAAAAARSRMLAELAAPVIRFEAVAGATAVTWSPGK